MNKIYLSDFYYFGRILPSHHSPILSLPLTLAFALPPAHLTLSGSSTGSYVMLLTKKSAAALSFHPGWPADRGERASARPGAKARRKGGGWARISACRPCWSTAVAASWKHCAVPCMEACTLEGRGFRKRAGGIGSLEFLPLLSSNTPHQSFPLRVSTASAAERQ